jgi:molybdate transport system ATP-binding protein
MMAEPTPLVTLNRASVLLGGRRVLHDIDWSLSVGENTALFGANGSGKTTLLRLIAGSQWPMPGEPAQRSYDFGGGPEYHAVNALARIRLVSPELHDRYQRFRWNPVGEVLIATGYADSPILRFTPDDGQRERIAALAEQLGIRHLLGLRFLDLSRGEQRKLLLARALVARPAIVLFDEICDGLDQDARQEILWLIDRLAEQNSTFVFATHRRFELPRSVNRILELGDGRVLRDDTYRKPRAVIADEVSDTLRDNLCASSATQCLIAIENADIYRGDQLVLTNLNWRLESGCNWLIRGANGAGKSTLIKLLNAEFRPALGGTITWFGLPGPVNVWDVRRRLGLVSDELQGLYSDAMTVADCVATGFAASIGRVPSLNAGQRQEVVSCLEQLGLSGFDTASIRRLSYGQFRRVLIARALVQKPAVLLLDEPMSGLDSATATVAWSILMQLSRAGTSLVMSSHESEIPDSLFANQLQLIHGRALISAADNPG